MQGTQLRSSLSCATQAKTARTQNVMSILNGNAARLGTSKAVLTGTKLMACGQSRRLNIQRVVAATASPVAPGVSSSASVDENAILDTVIVGAGVSGLTTAMVRTVTHILSFVFSFLKTPQIPSILVK
jgi:hypothetical protein